MRRWSTPSRSARDGRATDAYSEENQFIADRMAEAESVSARKATLLNPTEEDETVQVLRRRLFEEIDEAKAPGRGRRLPEPVDGARGVALHRGRPPRDRGDPSSRAIPCIPRCWRR